MRGVKNIDQTDVLNLLEQLEQLEKVSFRIEDDFYTGGNLN